MRYVIKNIFRSWYNIFGKSQGFPPGDDLPYSFKLPDGQVAILMYSGSDVPFEFSVIYQRNGVERRRFGYVTTPFQGYGIAAVGDYGSTCVIRADRGNCSHLEINGIVIFDNR